MQTPASKCDAECQEAGSALQQNEDQADADRQPTRIEDRTMKALARLHLSALGVALTLAATPCLCAIARYAR
jgi:hypothetical protein